jgi:hypothetical protein
MKRSRSSAEYNPSRRALLGLVAMAAMIMSACGRPGPDQNWENSPPADSNGFVAIAWTVNGSALNSTTCMNDQITSMSVFVTSAQDPTQGEEFIEVTCALNIYSMEMTPIGPVSIQVNAVDESSTSTCVRYSGQAQAVAGTQFPSQPTPVALELYNTCQ